MSGAYMGKMLFVDLSKGELKDETLEERIYHDFLGGYGIGARMLFDRQGPKIGPRLIWDLLPACSPAPPLSSAPATPW